MIKKRNDYISDGLIQIRDKLKAAPEEVNSANEPAGTDRVLKKASLRRYEDFLKARRDLIARYTESITALSEDAERFRKYVQEAGAFHAGFQANLEELEKMGEYEDLLAGDSAALSDMARKVENFRLMLIRDNVRLEKIIVNEASGNSSGSRGQSIIYELASLSLKQLMKMGIGFFFPVYLAILVAALVIVLAIILSMGIL